MHQAAAVAAARAAFDRGPWPHTPLTHAAITITNASSEPGVGQKQVERVLREARELVLADDAPPG